MEKRVSILVLVPFLAFFVAGCSMFGPKPVSETRWFFNNTIQIEMEGGAAATMSNAVKHYKDVVLHEKDDTPEAKKAIYELYVRADKNKNHTITEEEAKEFWESYRRQFDSQIGLGPIQFQ